MRPALLLCLLLSLPAGARSGSDGFFTFGPMVHLDFSRGARELSMGVELAYWLNRDLDFGIGDGGGLYPGWDVGVDFSDRSVRIYSEAQLGMLLGASAGPYLEFYPAGQGDRPMGYGLQGSIWGAAFLGVDVRGRLGSDGRTLAPGLFGKAVACNAGCQE